MAGLLEPYRGRYVSAESASTKLDVNAIISGCSQVDSEASSIGDVSTSLNSAASDLTPNIFSINGASLGANVGEYCQSIMDVQSSIMSATAQIRSEAIAAYNEIQSQLNQEAQSRDQYEMNRRNRRYS